MANETISEKCETLYNKLNTFVTSVISRDVTPKISNLNTEVWGSNTQTGDSRIDTLESDVTSLSDSITNLNTLAKSGKVDGISVQKQNVAGYTVTHNLGRPNVPVVTLNLGNSRSYAWANTQVSVHDITNNRFKVTIFNNTGSNGNLGFNWVVVATD